MSDHELSPDDPQHPEYRAWLARLAARAEQHQGGWGPPARLPGERCVHPVDALRSEITQHAEDGCLDCAGDPRNLNPNAIQNRQIEAILVDDGETLCPWCRTHVRLQPRLGDMPLVHNLDRSIHRCHPYGLGSELSADDRAAIRGLFAGQEDEA